MSLVALQALGPQDAYLTSDPTNTLLTGSYPLSTKFAVEAKKQDSTGDFGFGRTVEVQLKKHSDLCNEVWLDIDLPLLQPGFSYVNGIAYALLESVELRFGNVQFDIEYGRTLYEKALFARGNAVEAFHNTMANERGLFRAAETNANTIREYADIQVQTGRFSHLPAVGSTTQCRRLNLPLSFWFNKDVSQSLPTAALSGQNARLIFKFRKLSDVVTVLDPRANTSVPSLEGSMVAAGCTMTAACWAHFVTLTDEERKAVAATQHEYLVTEMERMATVDFSTGSNLFQALDKIDLRGSNPTRSIFWHLQHAANRRVRPLDGTVIRSNGVTSAAVDLRHSLPMVDQQFQINGKLIPSTHRETGTYMMGPGLRSACKTHLRVRDGECVFARNWCQDITTHRPTGSINLSFVNTLKTDMTVVGFSVTNAQQQDLPAIAISIRLGLTAADTTLYTLGNSNGASATANTVDGFRIFGDVTLPGGLVVTNLTWGVNNTTGGKLDWDFGAVAGTTDMSLFTNQGAATITPGRLDVAPAAFFGLAAGTPVVDTVTGTVILYNYHPAINVATFASGAAHASLILTGVPQFLINGVWTAGSGTPANALTFATVPSYVPSGGEATSGGTLEVFRLSHNVSKVSGGRAGVVYG